MNPITETKVLEVAASAVQTGDRISKDVRGKQTVFTVDNVKVGMKWATARDAEGNLVFEVLLDDKVTVSREVETVESKRARERARNNAEIERFIASFKPTTPAVLAKLTDLANGGYSLLGQNIHELTSAAAADQVYGRAVESLRNQVASNPEKAYVDAARYLRDHLIRDMIAKSRSLHNNDALEDSMMAHTAEIIDRLEWWTYKA